MSDPIPHSLQTALDRYQQFWIRGASLVLDAISGTDLSVEPLAPDFSEEDFQLWTQEGRWLRVGATAPLSGEQALLISRASVDQLTELLTEAHKSDPDPHGPTEDPVGALIEKFTRAAAQRWQVERGEGVEFPFVGTDAPGWSSAARLGFRLVAPESPPMAIWLEIGDEFAESLLRILASAGSSNPEPSSEAVTTAPDLTRINVDLLSDIELPVTLRLGSRELLLRDVMEFAPGMAVELDPDLEQTAELVVAGNVVAQGEVVIVDGNYGVRITEIAAPEFRLSALGGNSRRAFEMLSRRHGGHAPDSDT